MEVWRCGHVAVSAEVCGRNEVGDESTWGSEMCMRGSFRRGRLQAGKVCW